MTNYIIIKHNNKNIVEHRYMYEQYYKCSLLKWVEVHHINGNKRDNRIENLEPLNNKQHKHKHRNIDSLIQLINNRLEFISLFGVK